MEQLTLVLIIITLLLLVVIVGLLTILIYKMFRQQSPSDSSKEETSPDTSKSEFHPAIVERMKEMEKLKPKRADLFCPNHTEEPGEASCAICDRLFCRSCIKPFKALHFCKEHLPLVMTQEWEEVLTLKTSTQDPERGVQLFQIKKELFHNDAIPTFIETHYKINVDQDSIETYLVLFAEKSQLETLKNQLTHLLDAN
jgi:hypothetical protein